MAKSLKDKGFVLTDNIECEHCNNQYMLYSTRRGRSNRVILKPRNTKTGILENIVTGCLVERYMRDNNFNTRSGCMCGIDGYKDIASVVNNTDEVLICGNKPM